MPQTLINLKERNRGLIWNSTVAEIVNKVLCFLWQDNNTVLGITTAFNLHFKVYKERKRPSLTLTNARIIRPVFRNLIRK
jgi:hypothetical protein